MPFDPSTVGGFAGTFFSGLIFGASYLTITAALASFFLSMGLFLRAFNSHFASMFRNINALVESPPYPDRVIQLKACLIEAINFHSQAKE